MQIGSEGPLVVDTQPAASEREGARSRCARLSPRPIRHIVLTSGGDQQAGGAAKLSKAGRYIRVIDSIDPRGIDIRASIIAHLNVLNRMSAGNAPSDSWPTDTYFTPEWSIFSNGEAVQLVSRRVGAQRRRHDRLLPPLRRRQHWRDLRRQRIPAFRSGTRRQHRRDHRRFEPRARYHRAGREPGGRHGRRPGSRSPERRNRRRQLPRHGDDHPRPRARDGRERAVARAGASRRHRRPITTVCSSLGATGRARCSSRPSTAT